MTTPKKLHTVPLPDIEEALTLSRKPCDCCGRPWTTTALADRFGVGRLSLMRAMHAYEVTAPRRR